MFEGSSPRVRGTAASLSQLHHCLGIIPACAGNSVRLTINNKAFWDHPRVCGEQTIKKDSISTFLGSSPRVRGTVFLVILILHIRGIIPACAGNSKCVEIVETKPAGSSPRVRGTAAREEKDFPRTGIIPACAGNRPLS